MRGWGFGVGYFLFSSLGLGLVCDWGARFGFVVGGGGGGAGMSVR